MLQQLRIRYSSTHLVYKVTFRYDWTVTDADNGFLGMQTKGLSCRPDPLHDMEIQSLTPNPVQVNPGAKITVSVSVKIMEHTMKLQLVGCLWHSSAVFGSTGNQSAIAQGTVPFHFTLDTTGFVPGVYNLTATVTILPSINNTQALDQIPANNIAITEFQINTPTSNSSTLPLIAGASWLS